MTGRDIIIFILEHRLENASIRLQDFLISEEEVAAKFSVGLPTVKRWCEMGMLEGIKVGNHVFFFKNITDPRKGDF